MFHIGHLRLLERARQNCDLLIVGVSLDDLVFKYKKKKPIIPLQDRMEIINALECVDKVIVQSHRDKIKQYHEIQYDVVFVGDDWKGDPLWIELEKELAKHSARVMYFSYTHKVSSSKLTEVLTTIQDGEKF